MYTIVDITLAKYNSCHSMYRLQRDLQASNIAVIYHSLLVYRVKVMKINHLMQIQLSFNAF